MNRIERRQYKTLLKVRDFGNTHRQVFSTLTAAQQIFDAVNAAIDELAATDMMKMSASASAGGEQKADAKKALADLLQRVSQLAKVLRADGVAVPAFDLPRSKSDQALLTAGRQFAHDAASFDDVFSSHGMGPTAIAAATTAFETAANDRARSRADHIKARLRIHELLGTALRDVRRLDLMVANEVPNDPVVQGLWKQARHVDEARRDKSLDSAQEKPPGDGAAEQPPAVPDAGKAA